MSVNSATGGGAIAPGWYTDPHDPRQLRWWSGEGWTEHVSAGSSGTQAAQQDAASAGEASDVAQASEPVPAQAAQDAPLPSRRTLRDPATEASEAAEAALAAQAAQREAQFAEQRAQRAEAAAAAAQQSERQAAFGAPQVAAQAAEPEVAQPEAVQPEAPLFQAAQFQPVQPQQPAEFQPVDPQAAQAQYDAPVAAAQPSAPVPTLPVAPTSFLAQQGYAPLDGAAPANAGDWARSAVPEAASAQPQVSLPPQLVQPAEPSAPSVPLAESVPSAQSVPAAQSLPAQSVPSVQSLPSAPSAQPTAWNLPVQPTQPEQQGWGTPAPSSDGLDSLLGGAPSGQVAAQDPQGNQWGLSPSDAESGSRRQVDEVAGSSSIWAWLIAISPILAGGSIGYVLLATKSALTDWPFETAVAVPYVLVLLFALADRAALLRLGHAQPRSPIWALLTAPAYLIARASETRREDGSGTVLTLVWFVSVIVTVAGLVGYGLLTHHALITGLPT